MVLKVDFEGNIPEDLTMVCWTQLASGLAVDKTKTVGLS
jgi:hypothetical protein